MVDIMVALWFASCSARPGVGQAARLAGAARDQLPARRPGRAYLTDAAREGRPAVLPVPDRRTPTPSTSRPARSASARPRRSGRRSRTATCARSSRRHRRRAHSSACSATPSSTRARSGRPWRTRRCRGWASCCGSSTSTGSRWTGWCRTSRSAGCRACSRPPAGRSITLKWGRLLCGAVRAAGRRRAAAPARGMPNEEYQRMLRADAGELRERAARRRRAPCARAGRRPRRRGLAAAVRDLGGHDLGCCVDTYRGHRRGDRPPDRRLRLHGQGRGGCRPRGTRTTTPRCSPRPRWTRWPRRSGIDRTTRGAVRAGQRRGRAVRAPRRRAAPSARAGARRPPVPAETSAARHRKPVSTQAALGRLLPDLARDAPEVRGPRRDLQPGRRLLDQPRRLDQPGRDLVGRRPARLVRRRPRDGCCAGARRARPAHRARHRRGQPRLPARRARRDLVARWGERLLPIATIYDPFVSRALEPWSYGIYAGGQSILVGTPSGVTLAPRAARTSRSPRRRSGSSSPAASPGSRPSPRTSSGPSCTRWRGWASRAAPRRTSGCRPGRSTRPGRRPMTRRAASAGAAGDRGRLPAAARPDRARPERHARRRRRDHARGVAAADELRARASRRGRLPDQPRPGVPRAAGPAGPRATATTRSSTALPGRPRRAARDRPGRPPAHARRSSPPSAGCRIAASASPSSASPATSTDAYRLHGLDTDTITGAALDLAG